MANRNERTTYTKSRQSDYSSYNTGRNSRAFRFNAVNVTIIAVLAVSAIVIGIILAQLKKPTIDIANAVAATPGYTSEAALQSGSTQATGSDTANPTDSAAASPASTPAATVSADGFFTGGEVQIDDTTYKSADLFVKITNINENGQNYYVADCRMKDSSRLFTALATDQYVMHTAEPSSDIARRKGAVIAINGDYYGFRNEGIVIRNGQLHRETPYNDVAAIFGDGTMKTFTKSQTTAKKLVADGATQAFGFGPMLLGSDGTALAKFNPPLVKPANPRSGIGYIEPNHFVLAVVDGRGSGGGKGMTMAQFAKLFESLGCKSAYNFDGGGSATMVFMGKVINHPCDVSGERSVSDIVYFGESETDQTNVDRFKNQ